jgi:GntR family transcriptional regulator
MIEWLKMTDVDHRLPLYHRLRDQIASQIAKNLWLPGEAIPTEAELAETHNVAIGTVRRAIQTLVEDGLVERMQGRGTFVRRASFDSSFFRFLRLYGPDGRQEVPDSKILSRDCLNGPAEVTKALQLPEGEEVIRLLRLRLIGGRTVLGEEIWLPLARFVPFLAINLEDIGPLLYPTYEKLCGEIVASAKETLTVETADSKYAGLLGLDAGTPVVVIERLAFGYDRKPIEWRRSRAPASTFRYQIEIR